MKIPCKSYKKKNQIGLNHKKIKMNLLKEGKGWLKS
jgi:hypothetical protein